MYIKKGKVIVVPVGYSQMFKNKIFTRSVKVNSKVVNYISVLSTDSFMRISLISSVPKFYYAVIVTRPALKFVKCSRLTKYYGNI